jgi:excisionase family DNA binding protein
MEPIFLTVEETAALISKDTTKRQVMDMCRQKKLPAMKMGKHWYIHKEKFDVLIKKKTNYAV